MRNAKVTALVFFLTLAAGALLLVAGRQAQPFPGLWGLVSFVVAALLLEKTGEDLRYQTRGSTSFVIHLAGGVVFGAFWGGVIAGLSTVLSEIDQKKSFIKALFNTAQRVVAVTGGVLLTVAAGAHVPMFDFSSAAPLIGAQMQRNLLYFVLFAILYFAVNGIAVSLVVSLSSGKRFMEIWSATFRGVLGYDLGASFLALVLGYLYVRTGEWAGLGALGLAIALAPILVIRHIYGLYRRLQNSGRELLDLMVKAIEARDPYTSGHSVRVATLARTIAQEAKMSTEEVEQVYTAAVLHDVGKIHEEFAPLLRKDSKLTPEETALLQTHSVKSADLVGIITSFRGTVQDAVRSHHERWDGGGYPDGLSGESIPLGARIIMISDTTDAMTTDRPYRKRLPIDAVVAELQKYRGTQFDPRLVDLVVNSVTVRRVMAELTVASARPGDPTVDLGSKRVQAPPAGLLRGRPSWPRIRAF